MTAATLIITAALSVLGRPYAWGAAGPDAFDCSGLVVWSYQHAGITVPRTSQSLATNGQPVTRDQLQPGDVVTYYPDARHVGLYTGTGNVIHASTDGVPVAEVPLDNAGPFHNARTYLQEIPMTDTLFADVSEFQAPVDDSYPYPVLSIRVCDGTYRDHHFAQNYAWMRAALDSGKLTFGIVYTYVRPSDWVDNAATVRQMIDTNGGLHPRVALMLDVESGGNPLGDQSGPINSLYTNLATYAGNAARVIGYANAGDFANLWRTRPIGLRVIGAGYGANPQLPGQIAHQYTNGTGFSPNLPQGCPPFGNCDMNSADGLDPASFGAACGITTTNTNTGGALMALTDDEQTELLIKVRDIWDQLRGPGGNGWPQLGQNAQGQDLTPIDALGQIKAHIELTTSTPPIAPPS